MSFVTAFRGSRDGFQLPLALAKAGLLSEHITDFAGFSPTGINLWLMRLLPWLGRRRSPEISNEQLRTLAGIAIRERFTSLDWESEVRRIDANDSRFSTEALRAALRTESHLFLYHPYAYEAFSDPRSRDRVKILFQYHPSAEYERCILAGDRKRSQIEFQIREYAEILPEERLRRWSAAVELADLVVCPSSGVAESVQEMAGKRVPPISLVPYGAETSDEYAGIGRELNNQGRKPYALFVGNGIQRKGIHWLLKAWQECGNLARDLDLVLVIRRLDPAIVRGFRLDLPGLRIHRDVPPPFLKRLMRQAAFLVNPSLLEGFGHVYLEALALGTPVLGSRRSILADLPPSEDVMIWNPEDPESLRDMIATSAGRFMGRYRTEGFACAVTRSLTWDAFRKEIAKIARNSLP